MNLSAGSDPSLNFPKPFPFSPAYKTTNTTQQSAPFDSQHSPTTWPLGAIATYLLPYTHHYTYYIPHTSYTIYPPPFTIQSSTLTVGHWLYYLCEIAYIASASTLILLHTQTTSAPRTRTLAEPFAARLHRNFIPIWLSYPIEITHASPDILLTTPLQQRLSNMRLEGTHH